MGTKVHPIRTNFPYVAMAETLVQQNERKGLWELIQSENSFKNFTVHISMESNEIHDLLKN